jgi:MtaA/CmuA family methyltransferase
MSDRVAAIGRFHEEVGGKVPIMGWVEGALAEVADLRGVGNLLFDLYDRPEWVDEFLRLCADVGVQFARAQVAAGADIIGLGDALASQVSPAMYRRFALPHEKRIFAAVHEMGALCRLHICGNTTRILEDMVASGADIIDLDWMVDFGHAAHIFGDRAAPCGNMDPVAVMQYGTPSKVRELTVRCLETGGARAISAAGCEIPDGTPHQNLQAQTQALADFGSRNTP